MKLVISADHAGFPLKEEVRAYLTKAGHEIVDLGAYNAEPSDYPDFAEKVGEAIKQGVGPVRTFMLAQTSESDVQLFLDLSKRPRPATVDEIPIEVVLPAFVTSELKTAFTMGFLLFIPFLVIDLVVASALMAMGMVMVSPTQIALPFKLLLFVLVDGWVLIVSSLVKSFGA